MTNKLNRSDYLILDTLHGSNMTDQFHSMTIEEIMEETGNVLGVRMTVYRMVTKLVKLGYLEKGVMDNHANTYYLTNEGRNYSRRIKQNEDQRELLHVRTGKHRRKNLQRICTASLQRCGGKWQRTGSQSPGDVPNKYILQGFDGFGGHGKELWIVWLETKISSNLLKESKKTLCLFSLPEAGSTGSGCAPIVAEMLLEEKDEEGNPVKTVCPVIALPASGESLAKHKNAYETVQELQEIEGLGATFFLNNDSNENYDYINKNFASMLDEFLSNESYGRQNNFDESERLEMLKDSGAMVLSVTGDGTDSKIKLEKLTKSGIFAPIEDNYICENIGIIHSKNDKSDIDSEDVIAEVGKPDNVFEGFNGRKTIIAASGLDYPVSHVKKLGELAVKANAERMRNKKSTRAKLGSLELPEVDITEQKEEPTKKRMTKLELLKKRRGQ